MHTQGERGSSCPGRGPALPSPAGALDQPDRSRSWVCPCVPAGSREPEEGGLGAKMWPPRLHRRRGGAASTEPGWAQGLTQCHPRCRGTVLSSSSPTRDQTHSPFIGSTESSVLACQGSPLPGHSRACYLHLGFLGRGVWCPLLPTPAGLFLGLKGLPRTC